MEQEARGETEEDLTEEEKAEIAELKRVEEEKA